MDNKNKQSSDNLRLILNKNKIEKISLEVTITSAQKELDTLKTKERKLTKTKGTRILTVLGKLTYSLTICLLLMCYISFLVDKMMFATTALKSVYLVAIYLGVIALSTIGAFIPSQIENKIRKKREEKQDEISKQIKDKTKEINKNKEQLSEIEEQIKLILNEINKQELIELPQLQETTTSKIKDYPSSEGPLADNQQKPYTRTRTIDNNK